jgi:hypothetical protein
MSPVARSTKSTTAPWSKVPLRWASSITARAVSSVTSRAQPSEVLKATTRTGFLYSPLIKLRTIVPRSDCLFIGFSIRATKLSKVVED